MNYSAGKVLFTLADIMYTSDPPQLKTRINFGYTVYRDKPKMCKRVDINKAHDGLSQKATNLNMTCSC